MDDFGFGALMEKNNNPMVDFNYDIQKKQIENEVCLKYFLQK